MAEPQIGGVQLCVHIFNKWYFLSAFYRDLNFENRTISGWDRQLEWFKKSFHNLRINFSWVQGVLAYHRSGGNRQLWYGSGGILSPVVPKTSQAVNPF